MRTQKPWSRKSRLSNVSLPLLMWSRTQPTLSISQRILKFHMYSLVARPLAVFQELIKSEIPQNLNRVINQENWPSTKESKSFWAPMMSCSLWKDLLINHSVDSPAESSRSSRSTTVSNTSISIFSRTTKLEKGSKSTPIGQLIHSSMSRANWLEVSTLFKNSTRKMSLKKLSSQSEIHLLILN